MIKKRIFVVSCQALKNEPLYGKGIMTKMAKAAIISGADWIRTSQIHNINDMLDKINVPIIGIIKKTYQNSDVFITPTINELAQLINSNVQIIAIDATLRKRPNESLEKLVKYFFLNRKKGQKIMADCSNINDVKNAIKLKFDMIGTTLNGYTKKTIGMSNLDNDFEFLKTIRKLTTIDIVAEGGIETPEQANRAFLCGANIVVVGSAITRPRTIVKRFVKEIRK